VKEDSAEDQKKLKDARRKIKADIKTKRDQAHAEKLAAKSKKAA
jgi:hypothetical protein